MKTFPFPSKSNPSAPPHITTLHDAGDITCTCRGFRSYQKCRHVTEVERFFIGEQQTPVIVEEIVVESGFIQPMLASPLPAGKRLEDYANTDYVLEEKYDGHHLIVRVSDGPVVQAWSRAAIARTLPAHLVLALRSVAPGTYAAELIVPGGTSTDVVDLKKQHLLEFVFFDMLTVQNYSCMAAPYRERRMLLEGALSKAPRPWVRASDAMPVSQVALDRIWARGGEGAIIKRVAGTYEPDARSKDWIKFKKRGTAELRITGFEAGKLGPHSKIQAVNARGIEISVKTLNDHWREVFATRAAEFIGKTLVIEFQQQTRDGRYRHPMADHIKEVNL